MAAQSVTWRQVGVVEVVGGVIGHAELFHHAAGAQVFGNGEGDEAVELKGVEGLINDGARALSRQAAAPAIGGKTPADFDCRHERCVKVWDIEADKADEGSVFNQLCGVETEAVAVEMLLDAGDEIVGLLRQEQAGHELHDAWISVDGLKRDAVRFAPAAEVEPVCGEGYCHARRLAHAHFVPRPQRAHPFVVDDGFAVALNLNYGCRLIGGLQRQAG